MTENPHKKAIQRYWFDSLPTDEQDAIIDPAIDEAYEKAFPKDEDKIAQKRKWQECE